MQIEQWLWQLRGEVQKLQELGFLLKSIGCFRPRPVLPSVVRPRSSAVPTNPDGASLPLSSPMGEHPSKSMAAVAVSTPPETTVGGGNENHTITSDLAGTRQDEATATSTDKNVTFGAPSADNDRDSRDHRAAIDFRAVESQVQEGLESLEFHLAVLQRSVDQAHINMRIASQEFSSLLKKVLNNSDEG